MQHPDQAACHGRDKRYPYRRHRAVQEFDSDRAPCRELVTVVTLAQMLGPHGFGVNEVRIVWNPSDDWRRRRHCPAGPERYLTPPVAYRIGEQFWGEGRNKNYY